MTAAAVLVGATVGAFIPKLILAVLKVQFTKIAREIQL